MGQRRKWVKPLFLITEKHSRRTSSQIALELTRDKKGGRGKKSFG